MRLLFVLCIAAAAGGCCALSAPAYHGPVSDHFDGEIFFDHKPHRPGVADMLKWQLDRKPAPWPAWIESEPGPKPPARVGPGEMRVTFVNHATVLVQVDGINVLTDPIWSERASPISFAGPRRVRAPGIRFEDLPPIDVVLLSHDHYDHFDLPTLQRLSREHPAIFVTGLGNDAILREAGIPGGRALDWWQSTRHRGLVIHSVPNQHFCNRGLCDQDQTLWTAFVVVSPRGGSFYVAGDTGYGAHFKEVAKRFPGLRLALLPIGSYKPEWFMSPVHEGPAEALQALKDLGAGTAVATHYGTFNLGDDGPSEAPDELQVALAKEPEPKPRFWILGFGEGREVP